MMFGMARFHSKNCYINSKASRLQTIFDRYSSSSSAQHLARNDFFKKGRTIETVLDREKMKLSGEEEFEEVELRLLRTEA